MARHALSFKGLVGCGINTAAPVGTVFTVPFYVWDHKQPALNATVNRTVIIDKRCLEDENFCPDFTGGFFCS